MTTRGKLTNSEVLRKVRVTARAEGRCIECHKNDAKPGRVTCQACLDRRSDRAEARVGAGLCPCGRKKSVDRYSCATCLRIDKRKRHRLRKIDRALNRCTSCRTNPAGPAFKTCTSCREKSTARYHAKLAKLERLAA